MFCIPISTFLFKISGSLRDVNAPGIIPVDLNSFLHANALALSTWWIRLGNEEKSRRYRDIANEFLRGLQEVISFYYLTDNQNALSS